MSKFGYLTIKITYWLQDVAEPCYVNLAPEEYFDIKYLDVDEMPDADDVSLHWNSLDYLDSAIRKKVRITRLEIYDKRIDSLYTVEDTYWNSQNNLLRVRTDYLHGEKKYHLILLSLKKTSTYPVLHDFVRLEEHDGHLSPLVHTVVQETSDGIELDTLESYTIEKAFNRPCR